MTKMIDESNKVKVRSSKNVFKAFRTYLIDSIRELNLYNDDPFWSSRLTYFEEIVNTRLYIILVSLSILIVMIYSSLIIVTHNVILHKFSIDDYERLENAYPYTMSGLCNEVSIPYNKFLNLYPIYHEVCSSPFISNKWISSLFLLNATSHNILDYRTFAFAQYRSLGLLCNISRQSIKDTYRRLNSTSLTNHQVLSRNQFNNISSVLFNNLQQNILTNEKQTGNLISMITAHNQLWTALRTNYYITCMPESRYYRIHPTTYLEYNQTENSICYCKSKGNQCFYPAGAFYNWTVFEIDMPAKDYPPPRFHVRQYNTINDHWKFISVFL
jgi:hypothetical protein